MTKKLYLLRHADAKDESATGQDIDRELSSNGRFEAESLAKRLLENHIKFDEILCSMALRVRQTYDIIAPSLFDSADPQYLDRFYNPRLETLLDALKGLKDSDNSVLIISHNPTTSDLATYLTGNQIHFSAGVLKYLELEIESWADIEESCGRLVWSIPD